MPKLSRFDPPAFLPDFDRIPGQRDGWDRYISSIFTGSIRRLEQAGVSTPQFYDETQDASEGTVVDQAVQWFGFPQTLVAQFGRSRALRMADEPARDSQIGGLASRLQDEYLEWRVERTTGGKIVHVTFTCEGPEYWQAIAGGPSFYDQPGRSPEDFGAPGSRDVLVDLYRDLLGTDDVQPEDLFFPDEPNRYNPWNEWDTEKGIVHLQQINIGADGTVLREKGGPVTDATRLICCGGFGGPERASDPHLGAVVNSFARRGFAITLRNPVGIYIEGIDDSAITKPGPDGTREPAGGHFRVVRPEPSAAGAGLAVRAVYEVPQGELGPDGAQLTVGDLQIAGVPIAYGGQLAEKVTMQFFARVCREGELRNDPQACDAKCCRENGVLNVVDLGDACDDVFPAAQRVRAAPPTFAAVESIATLARSRRRR